MVLALAGDSTMTRFLPVPRLALGSAATSGAASTTFLVAFAGVLALVAACLVVALGVVVLGVAVLRVAIFGTSFILGQRLGQAGKGVVSALLKVIGIEGSQGVRQGYGAKV